MSWASILIVWFLISIPVGIVLGKSIKAVQGDEPSDSLRDNDAAGHRHIAKPEEEMFGAAPGFTERYRPASSHARARAFADMVSASAIDRSDASHGQMDVEGRDHV